VNLSGFYFITDPVLTRAGMLGDVEAALAGGAAIVQYRDKRGPSPELCRRMVEACRAAGVPLLVNDDLDLAAAAGADGVHVGQTDTGAATARALLGPRAIVGVSVATVAELSFAEAAGASYVAASPVFATPTKLDAGSGIGLAGVRVLRAATRLPLAVIGGLGDDNIGLLAGAGADLFCAISASYAGGDVKKNVRRLCALIERSV
jgi:thiamine-phosphate pyrophosphorylase